MAILTGSDLLARARRYADDSTAPYYISDTEMYTWITEAEKALAVAGKLLRDVREYSIEESDRWVRIPNCPDIIEFKKAVLIDSNGTRFPLKLYGTMDSSPLTEDDEDYGMVSITSQLTENRPEALFFGKRTNYFEVSPVANADYTVEAQIVQYPAHAIENSFDEPTIGVRHHPAIAIGAALMAIQGSEDEHFLPRVQNLERAWQQALLRAAEESGAFMRDASVVEFRNDLWG